MEMNKMLTVNLIQSQLVFSFTYTWHEEGRVHSGSSLYFHHSWEFSDKSLLITAKPNLLSREEMCSHVAGAALLTRLHPARILLGLRPCGLVSSPARTCVTLVPKYITRSRWLIILEQWATGNTGKNCRTWKTALTVQRWQSWQQASEMKECQSKSQLSPSYLHGKSLLLISVLKMQRSNKIFTEEAHLTLYSVTLDALAFPTHRQYCDCRSERDKNRQRQRSDRGEVLRVSSSHEIISCSRSLLVILLPDTVTQTGCRRHFWKTTELINPPPGQSQERKVLHTSLYFFTFSGGRRSIGWSCRKQRTRGFRSMVLQTGWIWLIDCESGSVVTHTNTLFRAELQMWNVSTKVKNIVTGI